MFRRCVYQSSGGPFVWRSGTICATLVEGIKRNNSVKLFEFGLVVQETLFKRFLIWSSGGPPVQWIRIIYATLEEGIMGNIHVTLFEIWTKVQEMSFKEKVYSHKTDKEWSQKLTLCLWLRWAKKYEQWIGQEKVYTVRAWKTKFRQVYLFYY